MASEQFYKRVKGPMDNYEDWYEFEELPSGQQLVTHSWSHVTPSLASNSGSKTYTVEEFLNSTDANTNAQVELRNALDRRQQ